MKSFISILLLLAATAHAAEEVSVKEMRNLSPEKCLLLPGVELATRCPTVAGRHLLIGNDPAAVLDRLDQRRGTLWCDQAEGAWHCRRIVVIDRDLRSARKREAAKFVTAAEILRLLTTAPSVKIGDEFGLLTAPRERPRTCLDIPQRGCAVQPARLRGHGSDLKGTPAVRRRLWLVEDVDGPVLQCSDAELRRCDELSAASWLALVATLRPSSLAPPEPPPEIDLPEVRSDRRKGAPIADGPVTAADTPAGALDAFIRPKLARGLPPAPQKAEVQKVMHALEARGKPCLKDLPTAAVEVIFAGEGHLISLLVDGQPADNPTAVCLNQLARKMAFPRSSAPTFHVKAVIQSAMK